VDAPHELPLQPGQTVAMRAWWRHWNLQEASHPSGDGSQPVTAGAPSLAQQHQRQAAEQLAAGWSGRVTADWAASLAQLESSWGGGGERFDGILGFSNGAAAGFLLAAHAAQRPEAFPGLRFVVLAGGYVPQPLQRWVCGARATMPVGG
jgi:hypothetical protein